MLSSGHKVPCNLAPDPIEQGLGPLLALPIYAPASLNPSPLDVHTHSAWPLLAHGFPLPGTLSTLTSILTSRNSL